MEWKNLTNRPDVELFIKLRYRVLKSLPECQRLSKSFISITAVLISIIAGFYGGSKLIDDKYIFLGLTLSITTLIASIIFFLLPCLNFFELQNTKRKFKAERERLKAIQLRRLTRPKAFDAAEKIVAQNPWRVIEKTFSNKDFLGGVLQTVLLQNVTQEITLRLEIGPLNFDQFGIIQPDDLVKFEMMKGRDVAEHLSADYANWLCPAILNF